MDLDAITDTNVRRQTSGVKRYISTDVTQTNSAPQFARWDRQRWSQRALLLATFVLATALRFAQLDAQSFWNDEGNTARLVERSIPLIIEGAAGDIHPPGYYLLLHAWRALTGESEFALRGFSAFCGILTVAVAAAIGQRAGGRYTALGAAWLTALHPLAVYYSQEARMYALLGLTSALTLWAAIQLITHVTHNTPYATRDIQHAIFLALCIVLGLYTQYTYILALVGLNLAFGLWWLPTQLAKLGNERPSRHRWRWRAVGFWASAHLVGALAFAPWAPIALGASDWRPPDLVAEQALPQMMRALVGGITLPPAQGQYALVVMGILAGLTVLSTYSLLHRSRQSARFTAWASLAMTWTPPMLITLMGTYRPAYLKFLMMCVTPLSVWLALPLSVQTGFSTEKEKITTQRRRDAETQRVLEDEFSNDVNWRHGVKWVIMIAGGVLLISLLPMQVTSLQHLYTDPAYQRDDYRSIAARISAQGQPGDAILLNAPNQWEVFTYYYRGPLPVYPAPYRPTPEEAATWVEDIVTQHRQLFVLYWGNTESDPQHRIAAALAERAYRARDTWISDVLVARYGTGPQHPDLTAYVDAHLGTHLVLVGYHLPQDVYAPGVIIPLTLFWHADSGPGEPLKVFVHVLDDAGQLVAQYDGQPRDGLFPTHLWDADTQLMDHYGVWLPNTLPAGVYTLQVGMYRFSGERLTITQDGKSLGDTLPLTTVTLRGQNDD
jgi:hypothetical protein